MIHHNVELHNIAEVHQVPGKGGVRLQRVPETVREKLNPGAQLRMLSPACAEIRFVSADGRAKVTLSCLEGATTVVVFYGPFQQGGLIAVPEKETTIEVELPERLRALDGRVGAQMPFAPNVIRLMLAGGPCVLHGVEGQGLRPPRAEELPRLRYLAYGTSITHGAAATAPHLAYVSQTARRLGADLINLGVGGSAYCEPELADYIAERKDWQVASLALSVNMMGGGFSLEAFYERVAYMVNRVAGSDTARPVACITLYPHFRDRGEQFSSPNDKGTAEQFRQMLRDAVRRCPYPNARLIEGPEILTDIGGLTADLIHPGDHGMIQMGENLAQRLAPWAKGLV